MAAGVSGQVPAQAQGGAHHAVLAGQGGLGGGLGGDLGGNLPWGKVRDPALLLGGRLL